MIGACSEANDEGGDGDSSASGGELGSGGDGSFGLPTGGAASGGATGGAVSSGGASGGVSSGGAPAGGAMSGGAASGGDAGSAGGNGSGGDALGEFGFLSSAWAVQNNDDCTADAPGSCPLYPEDNTFFGANQSPEMSFENPPLGTQSFAIVLWDMSNGMTHWVIWDIPAQATMLPASLPGGEINDPAGASQAGFGNPPGYFGSGACGNVYEHRLYALSVAALSGNTTSADAVRTELESSPDVLGEVFVRMQSRDYCE